MGKPFARPVLVIGHPAQLDDEARRFLRTGMVIVGTILMLDIVAYWAIYRWYPELWPGVRRALLPGLSPTIVTYLERLGIVFAVDLVILRDRSALAHLVRFRKSERLDLFLAGIRIVGFGSVMPFILSGGFSAALPYYLGNWNPNLIGSIPSPVLQFFIVIIAADLLRYFWHRIQHEVDFLWRFHKLHHSATSFTILTGFRMHPVELILSVIFVATPLWFLGAPAATIAWVLVIQFFIDQAQHSMVPISLGWIGRWFVYTPVGHRIHHSPQGEHWGKNYGDLLTIWDHLFGTWYQGDRINQTVGVPANTYNQHGVVADLVRPVGESWFAFWHGVRTGRWRQGG